tara:strand:+ start:2114 stop:2926 length:813 start_codon:yes stop_codon:yes gene_type:complete
MTSSQVNVNETPPMSAQDLESLKDENGLYAGKFKSIEDLASSYKELEGKLGSINQTKQITEESEAEESIESEDQTQSESDIDFEDLYGDGVYSVLQEVGIDPADITERFNNEGEITEDDYAKLKEGGFSKQLVDTYLQGLKAGNNIEDIASVEIQGIKDSVGGDNNYEQMVNWARQNLSDSDISEFDELTETASTFKIKLAVQGLYNQYQNAMGIEPDLVTGRPSTNGPRPFQSTAEVNAAVSDPRYGKDVAYTESVYARYEGSNVFGQS